MADFIPQEELAKLLAKGGDATAKVSLLQRHDGPLDVMQLQRYACSCVMDDEDSMDVVLRLFTAENRPHRKLRA